MTSICCCFNHHTVQSGTSEYSVGTISGISTLCSISCTRCDTSQSRISERRNSVSTKCGIDDIIEIQTGQFHHRGPSVCTRHPLHSNYKHTQGVISRSTPPSLLQVRNEFHPPAGKSKSLLRRSVKIHPAEDIRLAVKIGFQETMVG
jgi:hypothetical protein